MPQHVRKIMTGIPIDPWDIGTADSGIFYLDQYFSRLCLRSFDFLITNIILRMYYSSFHVIYASFLLSSLPISFTAFSHGKKCPSNPHTAADTTPSPGHKPPCYPDSAPALSLSVSSGRPPRHNCRIPRSLYPPG